MIKLLWIITNLKSPDPVQLLLSLHASFAVLMVSSGLWNFLLVPLCREASDVT